MELRKNIPLALFAFALAMGFAVSNVEARNKVRCVDRVCMEQCLEAGLGNCVNQCRVDCEEP